MSGIPERQMHVKNLNHSTQCKCSLCKRDMLKNPLRLCIRCKGSDCLTDPYRLCTRCRNYLEKIWCKKYYEKIIPTKASNPNPVLIVKPLEEKYSNWRTAHNCGWFETQEYKALCEIHGIESKEKVIKH